MVHPGGRPRTQTPEKEELIELGEDLVAWALEKKEGELRARYCEWYTEKGFVMKQWDHFREKEEFRWYYERAKAILGTKYLDGTVCPSMAHRVIWKYVPESRAQDMEKMAYENSLKDKKLDDMGDKLSTVLDKLDNVKNEKDFDRKS